MRWVLLVLLVLGVAGGCRPGPSEQRLNCLQGCARDKDGCMLAAMTPPQIEYCDGRSTYCNQGCPQ